MSNVVELLKSKVKTSKDELEKALIKIEDLQAKLANEAREKEEAENDSKSSRNKVQLLDQELEKVNDRLVTITAKYEQASTAADESERLHRSILARSDSKDDRVIAVETQLE
jgi:uncharacterized phage infection (PIP) family protein YhgE